MADLQSRLEKAKELEKIRGDLGYDKKRAELKAERQAEEEKLGWFELADQLAQAATRYAAGRKGAAEGVDLSNLDIKGTDWDKLRERAMKRYEGESKDLSEQEKRIFDLLEKEDKTDRVSKRFPVRGVVEKGTKLPVYRIEGMPGYYNAEDQEVEVEKEEKVRAERPHIVKYNQNTQEVVTLDNAGNILSKTKAPAGEITSVQNMTPEEKSVIKDLRTKYIKTYKDLATEKKELQRVRELAESNIEGTKGTITSLTNRLVNKEVGASAEGDIQRAQLYGGIVQRFKSFLENWTGDRKLTPQEQKSLKAIIDLNLDSVGSFEDNIGDIYVVPAMGQLGNKEYGDPRYVSEENLYRFITGKPKQEKKADIQPKKETVGSPIGTQIEVQGLKYEKIKEGLDTDKATWKQL